MIIICGHMPDQWKNDEMIYVVPGQNIPKKDDVPNKIELLQCQPPVEGELSGNSIFRKLDIGV